MGRPEDDMINAAEDYDVEDDCAWSRREAARIKQIQIGKARPEYQRYVREVPSGRRTGSQPTTPDPRARVSKRQFDRALGDWRRRLHEFDAVPRSLPRHAAELEAQWSANAQQSSKNSWGGQYNDEQDFAEGGRSLRAANRRSRAAPLPPRGERSGKFGPRKPADSQEATRKESLAPPEAFPPPPPAAAASAASQANVVRISLADQLMDGMMSPMQSMMTPQMMTPYEWYPGVEAQWGNMETPPKLNMGMDGLQYMTMETPPDKPMMPGHAMCQTIYDESMLKADDSYLGMPVESFMIPHRLFDSSPDKSDQGLMLDSSNSETTTLESGEAVPSAERQAPESPRSRPPPSAYPMLSPSVHCLASPVPTTPKRQCYVPETPSPDRMHWGACMQPNMSFTQPPMVGGLPWHYGMQAHDQVIPAEFLQMMPCMAHEGQTTYDHSI